MLYLRNTNQQQSLTDNRFGGVQRGTLSNITASVTSSCVDYDGSGIIDVNDIVGGRGPLYNYSLYDLSASVFITQSTTVSSASIEDLSNSTYLLNISNLGLFQYTQSVVVDCPNPPDLEVEYLVVGGGDAVYLTGYGGGGGGFLSGSTSIVWNDTLAIEVGAGGTTAIDDFGKESYISSSIVGMLIASGAIEGQSGQPQGNSAGLGGPYPIGRGGGAGAAENGIDGTVNASGRGGNGLQWLNGTYYAGGGGGSTNGPGVSAGTGTPDFGGGGNGAGFPYGSGSAGTDGLGGGSGGENAKGGSGVVIIRYSTGSVRPAYGGVVTEVGGYVYHTFTGSADFRYAKQ
jgi:hypothetical protein